MKYLLMIMLTFCSSELVAQISNEGMDGIFNQAAILDLNEVARDLDRQGMSAEAKEKLLRKQYLSHVYNPALVDNLKTVTFLRYNIYKDEMELIKNDKIFYLKKARGRKVHFTTLNITYEIYELKGVLEFFMVKIKGKASLLVKQSIRYMRPQKAQSGYEQDKAADFKKKKDQYFLKLADDKIILVSNKNKDIPGIFGSKSQEIKDFMKKEKLSGKKEADIIEIVNFYNSLQS